MAPVGGNDEQHASRCESCTCDDRSSPMEPQGWNFRCNKPHSRNQDEQKTDFGEFDPGSVSDCEHVISIGIATHSNRGISVVPYPADGGRPSPRMCRTVAPRPGGLGCVPATLPAIASSRASDRCPREPAPRLAEQDQDQPEPTAAQRGGADTATASARPVAAPPPRCSCITAARRDRRTDGTASQGSCPTPRVPRASWASALTGIVPRSVELGSAIVNGADRPRTERCACVDPNASRPRRS